MHSYLVGFGVYNEVLSLTIFLYMINIKEVRALRGYFGPL